jgi:hypothetical protein
MVCSTRPSLLKFNFLSAKNIVYKQSSVELSKGTKLRISQSLILDRKNKKQKIVCEIKILNSIADSN